MDFDKHRKSQELNIEEISRFLADNGFTNIKLDQDWRHITGCVTKEGRKQFFKLASTKEVAERTKNEFAWNNLINNDSQIDLPVSVPKNYELGNYEGLFWFTCEFIKGIPLADVFKSDKTERLEENLAQIALSAKNILEIKTNKKLPNDERNNEKNKDIQKTFLDRLKHWMSQFENNAADLYGFIENQISYAQRAPSHSDFTPCIFL